MDWQPVSPTPQWTLRVALVDLQSEMDRVHREEERRILSPLARALLGAINVQDLIGFVPEFRKFNSIVHEAFGNSTDAVAAELDRAVDAFCAALRNDGATKSRSITDADLTTLIVLAAMLVDGFDRPDPPPQFYQVRRRTAAFIDEVQDFTEIEIFLMGMTVTREYGQITLAGDRRQRLQERGTEEYGNLFPFLSGAQMNQSIFLDTNFRQQGELRALSAGYRNFIQEGQASSLKSRSIPAAYLFDAQQDMADFILLRLLTVDPYATTAIILPNEQEARRWHDLLHDGLAAYHRPALLSHRDDLTRRNDIHFTSVRETKGLEFDVVVVPDISSFALTDAIGRNQLYVAITRPRHALLLGLRREAQADQHLAKLFATGLLKPMTLP
jgi:DNA helicase IV